MTAPAASAATIDSTTYDWQTFPYLAPRTTTSRMRHFGQDVFDITANSHLYKFIDALCGDAGAGSLKKELLFAQFQQNLNTIFFRDLDSIFGKIAGFARYASENYQYDPANQMLTTDEWNEVMTKDAWYRQRIKDFMYGLSLGCTAPGFRMMCRAALGVDCELYEVTYYVDALANLQVATIPGYNTIPANTLYPRTGNVGGIDTNGIQYGRTDHSLRNEVVIRPLKDGLEPSETYLLNGIVEQLRPQDSVVTIDPNGLAVHTPIKTQNVAAASSYFQVEANVTGVPDIAKLGPAQQLAQDLQVDPSYLWVRAGTTVPAPYPAFLKSQESSQYYYYAYGNNTAVDTIQYCEDTGDVRKLHFNSFSYYRTTAATGYGPWTPFDVADSPDNYPGGKNGQTPFAKPALTKSGTIYAFPFASQAAFVAKQTPAIVALGGQVQNGVYRMPLTKFSDTDKRTWDPTLAIPTGPPTTDSTVQTGWVRRPQDPASIAQWQRQTQAEAGFNAGGI